MEEIGNMPVSEFAGWTAYAKIKREKQEAEAQAAKSRAEMDKTINDRRSKRRR